MPEEMDVGYKLPVKKPGDNLTARHVNVLSEATEKVLHTHIHTNTFGRWGSAGITAYPPFLMRTAVITAEGYDDDDEAFSIRLRYWDFRDKTWNTEEDDGKDYCLDPRDVAEGLGVGDYVQVFWDTQRNAWRPVGGLRFHYGIVSENLGCGYYRIELARWSGNQETAGSGLGSTEGVHDCDVCWNIVNDGTSECGIALSYPPLQVEGEGEDTEVLAYDCASVLIPLVEGTACFMMYNGDRMPGGPSSSGTTASGSGLGEPVWVILRGLQEHVVEYKEEWSCCDGEGETGQETLLSRTPVILIGHECEPISCGTCTE